MPPVVLNRELVRKRIASVREAARAMGVREATLHDLISGKTGVEKARVGTIVELADLIGCEVDDLLVREPAHHESFAESMLRWVQAGDGTRTIRGVRVENPAPESERIASLKSLPDSRVNPSTPRRERPNPL